jgi:hypothetical protein
MQINLVFEPNATLAPSGFTTALEFAAQQLDTLITDNITFSIDVNWDSSGRILGEAGPENMQLYGYSQVVSALQAHAGSPVAVTAAAGMPATDPTNGYGVYLSIAQAEALGLTSDSSLPDGSVTFGTGGTVLNFSTSDLAVAGEEDFIGVAEHELTHAMGRSGWGDGSYYSLMDLFRFSSPGTLENSANIATGTSPAAYFSVDDGQSSLAAFSTASDYYDWSASVAADSFDAFSYEGVANTLSVADDDLMKALGFDVAACFCPGTRIATPAGEVAVECLAIGGEVLTKEGARRIKWIGRSAYAGRFIAGNPLMLPVTFAPGALAEGVPARPLTVSPGHGVCIGDALVPAWRLVNGVNVTQATRVDSVTYLHIELEQHALLLSEGCWSESYLNETPRSWFQNAAEYFALYPGKDVPGLPCLPRVEDGIALQALQYHVNSRAGLAWRPEAAGALHGEVEHMGQGICAGWAQSAEAPDVPVTLLVMRGAEILARVVANRYRPDLRAARRGSFCHGFALALPEAGAGTITVRRALDGAILPLVQAARAA